MENSSLPAIKRSPILLIVLGALAIILLRAPLWFIHWARDEGEYGLGAQQVLLGHLPYTTFVDNKGPLIYYLFALPLSITRPDDFVAVRIFATLVFIAGALVLYGISRRLAGETAALFSFFLYGTSALALSVEGFLAVTEIFMTLPLMVFFLYLLRGEKRHLFLCGLWCGIALLIRQTAFMYFFAGLIFVIISNLWQRKGFPFSGLLAMILGFIIPPFITVAVYAASGALHDLYMGYVFNNIAYIRSMNEPLLVRFQEASRVFGRALAENPLFFAGPIIAFPLFIWKEPSARNKLYVTILLFVSLYCSFSTKIYPRNLLQLLPLWAIAGACGVGLLLTIKDMRKKIATGIIAALLFGYYILALTPFYFRPMDEKKYVKMMPEIFIHSEELGRALRDASKPSDTILNWGVEYQMSFFTLRPQGMKYLFPIMLYISFADSRGDHFFRPEFSIMQNDILNGLYDHPPKFIVVTAPFFTYDKDVYFLPAKVEQFMNSRYHFIGVHRDSFFIYKLNSADKSTHDS
jgi:4-amino-4-deoxy-L-arabinose transferase-like glycosyltransferase